MWLKFGVAKLLCIYIGLTKFEENPEGSSFFCVDLTWNDPLERRERKDGRKCSLELVVGRTISYSSPGSLWAEVG